MTSRSWIFFGPGVLVLANGACGSAPSFSDESVVSTAESIYGGQLDDDANSSRAVVAVQIVSTSIALCSGSLVAPNVLVTARHCVSTALSDSIVCEESGASGSGTQLGADVDPTAIEVFTGAQPNLDAVPAARGTAIFHLSSDVLCNADVALVVLDTPILGITPLSVRLGRAMSVGESLRAVGYGENDQGAPAGTRFRKDSIDILAVGETVSASMTPLGSNEFELGLSICQGDSGGAAISEATGALVGVVSRGGSCTDDFGHVFTSLAGFESLFTDAFAMAGGAPTLEPPAGTSPEAGGVDASVAPSNGDGDDLHAGSRAGCSVSAASPADGGFVVSALLPSFFRGRRRRRAARRASSRSTSPRE